MFIPSIVSPIGASHTSRYRGLCFRSRKRGRLMGKANKNNLFTPKRQTLFGPNPMRLDRLQPRLSAVFEIIAALMPISTAMNF